MRHARLCPPAQAKWRGSDRDANNDDPLLPSDLPTLTLHHLTMSSTSTVDIPTTVLDKLKDFRLNQRTTTSGTQSNAVVIKINKNALQMEIEDEFQGISLEDLQEGEQQDKALPKGTTLTQSRALAIPELEENSPRYVALDFQLNHADGRVSFPLVLVYWCPQTSSTQLSTLYTSALSNLAVQADIGRVVDMRDGVLDRDVLEKRLGA